MTIAQETVGIYNPYPQSNWSDSQALLQELQAVVSAVTNMPTVPKAEIKSHPIE